MCVASAAHFLFRERLNEMEKAYIKSNIIAAIIALVVIGIGVWLTNYSCNEGSEYWILLAIPILVIGIFFLAIGPLIKPIRILLCLIAVVAGIMVFCGIVMFDHPWNTIAVGGGLECVFICIFCIVMAAQTEANYIRYKRALEEEKNNQG